MIKPKNRKLPRVMIKCFAVLYIAASLVLGIVYGSVPDSITVTEDKIQEVSSDISGLVDSTTVEAKLFGTIPIKDVRVDVVKEKYLVPSGDVFGVKFFTKGVLVVKICDIETKDGPVSPAKSAGLEVGDVIERLDGKEVNTVEDMASIIENSRGRELEMCYLRDGEEHFGMLSPLLSLSDKKYKTGIWVRDSTAGIGTVTYYDPETGAFAGLGHGICDVDTGLLMPLLKGSVVDVDITDIVKGKKGVPGELKGRFDNVKIGEVTQNTEHGIFGILNDCPETFEGQEPIKVGTSSELCEGKAYILCKLDSEKVQKYEIEIVKINGKSSGEKNFVIRITDKDLLQKTGGIVQGMSGSPIIQNDKLVGAVTHVLVNDPKKGYGIFIENMLP